MPAAELVAPVGDEDQNGKVGEAASEVVEQLPGRRIRPVNVLDHQQEGALARGQRQQGDDRLEEPQLRLGGVGGSLRRIASPHLGKELCELREPGAESIGEPILVQAIHVVADRLHERQIGK